MVSTLLSQAPCPAGDASNADVNMAAGWRCDDRHQTLNEVETTSDAASIGFVACFDSWQAMTCRLRHRITKRPRDAC